MFTCIRCSNGQIEIIALLRWNLHKKYPLLAVYLIQRELLIDGGPIHWIYIWIGGVTPLPLIWMKEILDNVFQMKRLNSPINISTDVLAQWNVPKKKVSTLHQWMYTRRFSLKNYSYSSQPFLHVRISFDGKIRSIQIINSRYKLKLPNYISTIQFEI